MFHFDELKYISYVWVLYQARRKDFWLLHTAKRVLKEFIPSLCHDADGLIFQVCLSSFGDCTGNLKAEIPVQVDAMHRCIRKKTSYNGELHDYICFDKTS